MNQFFDGERIQVTHVVGGKTYAYSGPAYGESWLWWKANVAMARAGEVMRQRDRVLVAGLMAAIKKEVG